MKSLLVLAMTFAVAGGWLFSSIIRSKQTAKVKGQFFCPSDPDKAKHIKVKLLDKDKIGFDDKMGDTRTDSEGNFYVEGSETEFGKVDARLRVYHNCEDKLKGGLLKGLSLPCKRKWDYRIPKKFINGHTLDIGRMNLEMDPNMLTEKRDCIEGLPI